jgi:hypothetical protein
VVGGINRDRGERVGNKLTEGRRIKGGVWGPIVTWKGEYNNYYKIK